MVNDKEERKIKQKITIEIIGYEDSELEATVTQTAEPSLDMNNESNNHAGVINSFVTVMGAFKSITEEVKIEGTKETEKVDMSFKLENTNRDE